MEQPNSHAGSPPEKQTTPTSVATKRYFKVKDGSDGQTVCKCSGETPTQAASRAYGKIIRMNKNNEKDTPTSMNIYLREITKMSPKGTFGFIASSKKLDQPVEFEIMDKDGNAKTTICTHRHDVKSIPVPEHIFQSKF